MTERIKHEYFSAPEDLILKEENTWFSKYAREVSSAIFIQEDVRLSRIIIASMLTEAWDERRFFEENAGLKPEPDETDRMLLIAHLQRLASFTGLLNGEEIWRIQGFEGKIPLSEFKLEDGLLPTFGEVASQTEKWKAEGLKIYMFHGGFDPPTILHLACAAEGYVQAFFQCDGRFRLLIGFEPDASREASKGENRPRYSANWRREVFGSFWMADSTVEMRTRNYSDETQRIQDYRDLNIDYVLLAVGQEEIDSRLRQIQNGGAEPRYFQHYSDTFHSTEVLDALKERGWL